MTPQQIAEVRPRLVAFAAEMLGGLAGKDQRAAGELYVRGLLADGRRKPMQPMAARLGVDHQRLQWGQHHLPAGAGDPGLAVRASGQGHHQRSRG
jgi:SRSO17 transposase